jgi:hypothetical protein
MEKVDTEQQKDQNLPLKEGIYYFSEVLFVT